ncbi:MAG: lipoprotein-releasing ABC transporter ATP-binding protein LolD [Succinivibrionaceae bacterium]|nr:lipoprotein-releasing ABC transporter ATP-binding protein LolD [Succinivibrionaceae bacterium]
MSEMNAAAVMELSDIRKTYREGKLSTEVLKGVSLSIPKGALMALVGASGSGKSTLLHIMGTLDRPTSGDVIFEGEKVSSWGESRQAEFRNRKLGFVYQFHHLLREFTALENVMMPEIISGTPMAEARERAAAMLERVGLKDRMDHRPSELSGGERQRTAIARALVNSPELVLADEPTGNLDFRAAGSVMDLIEELHESLGMAFVVVTHDRELAKRFPSAITIRDGKVAEESL